MVNGAVLAEQIWRRLVGKTARGTLECVRLVQTRDLQFEYAG
jgi:hypothetical protein